MVTQNTKAQIHNAEETLVEIANQIYDLLMNFYQFKELGINLSLSATDLAMEQLKLNRTDIARAAAADTTKNNVKN